MRKDNLKARLAYSTISQLSYIVLGAMLATNISTMGSTLHIVMHAFGKITLAGAGGLSHPHYANRHEYQAEVALLSRNVVVRGDAHSPPTDPQPAGVVCSDNARKDIPCHNYHLTGYGAHVLVGDAATARISSVEFTRVGQTNRIGRYPVHLHMLGEGGGRSAVSDCAVHESYYRGVVIHATNNTAVTRNVAYDVTGHCFYVESGNEVSVVVS